MKNARKTRECTLRVKQRSKNWCELGTQRESAVENWQEHNPVLAIGKEL